MKQDIGRIGRHALAALALAALPALALAHSAEDQGSRRPGEIVAAGEHEELVELRAWRAEHMKADAIERWARGVQRAVEQSLAQGGCHGDRR